MKKKFFVVFTVYLCLISLNLSAQNVLSKTADNLISEFMNLKMNLGMKANYKDGLAGLDAFYQNKVIPSKTSLNEQEIMILDNLYHTEKYGYYKLGTESEKNKSEKDLLNQLNANCEFIKKDLTTYNPWLLVTSGNVIGCYMSFHPVKTALKYGYTQKDYYEACYKQKPDFAYGTTHLAQWYFFAPGMYGGSNKKAEELFLKAISTSSSLPEKYFTNVYISQFYCELKNQAASKKYLDAAETLFPGTEYIKRLRKMNSEGKTLFHYDKDA